MRRRRQGRWRSVSRHCRRRHQPHSVTAPLLPLQRPRRHRRRAPRHRGKRNHWWLHNASAQSAFHNRFARRPVSPVGRTVEALAAARRRPTQDSTAAAPLPGRRRRRCRQARLTQTSPRQLQAPPLAAAGRRRVAAVTSGTDCCRRRRHWAAPGCRRHNRHRRRNRRRRQAAPRQPPRPLHRTKGLMTWPVCACVRVCMCEYETTRGGTRVCVDKRRFGERRPQSQASAR